MEKILSLALLTLIALTLFACKGKEEIQNETKNDQSVTATSETSGVLPPATDYTKKENWAIFEKDGTKEVDTIFFCPSLVTETKTGTNTGLPEEMLPGINKVLDGQVVAFEESTNVYVPLYRQLVLNAETLKVLDMSDPVHCLFDMIGASLGYEDSCKALDYYFENLNNGKPYILAGHSQGACVIHIILERYMKEHPNYYKNMVAAYAIGMSTPKDFIAKNPHIKYAKGADDTGVVISYNTEGPGATMQSILLCDDSYIINPINWKTDDTYASKEENLGSLVDGKIVMDYADAKIDFKRNALISTTEAKYADPNPYFGDKCLHGNDYQLYMNNLKENVKVRINSFAEKQTALDYSDKNNWMHFDDNDSVDHDTDMIYIYPTVTMSKAEEGKISDENKKGAISAYDGQGSAFASYTNVYVPYYRQLSMERALASGSDSENFVNECRNGVGKTDIFAALDYYFENCNKGKPYILSSHSQGSTMLSIVFEEYMREHQDYLKNMVACYAIGFPFDDEWIKDKPYLKYATGETDTGVIISWNTEGPGATKPNLCVKENGYVINPLNWKTDETYAGVELNLGSLEQDATTGKFSVGKGVADAQIDKKRGALICTADVPYPDGEAMINTFGEKCLHGSDYKFYFANITENGKKRIKAFMNR